MLVGRGKWIQWRLLSSRQDIFIANQSPASVQYRYERSTNLGTYCSRTELDRARLAILSCTSALYVFITFRFSSAQSKSGEKGVSLLNLLSSITVGVVERTSASVALNTAFLCLVSTVIVWHLCARHVPVRSNLRLRSPISLRWSNRSRPISFEIRQRWNYLDRWSSKSTRTGDPALFSAFFSLDFPFATQLGFSVRSIKTEYGDLFFLFLVETIVQSNYLHLLHCSLLLLFYLIGNGPNSTLQAHWLIVMQLSFHFSIASFQWNCLFSFSTAVTPMGSHMKKIERFDANVL